MSILEFARRVSFERSDLPAMIAKSAIKENKLGDLIDIFNEHLEQNPALLKKMLGNELFSIFTNFSQDNTQTKEERS